MPPHDDAKTTPKRNIIPAVCFILFWLIHNHTEDKCNHISDMLQPPSSPRVMILLAAMIIYMFFKDAFVGRNLNNKNMVINKTHRLLYCNINSNNYFTNTNYSLITSWSNYELAILLLPGQSRSLAHPSTVKVNSLD